MRLSELDEARFGVGTVIATDVDEPSIPELLRFCANSSAKFAIARTLTSKLSAVQALEQAGFQLMDTLVYFGGS